MWLLFFIGLAVALFFLANYLDRDFEFEALIEANNLPPWSNLDGFNVDTTNYTKYSTTYGEITARGMQVIKTIAPQISIFYDLGCGVGKSCIIAALIGYQKAIGIEIVKERYDIGKKYISTLSTEVKDKIQLFCGDYKTFAIKEQTPILIFVSNLLWSEHENSSLFDYLAKTIPLQSIIVASTYTSHPSFQRLQRIKVPMSWYTNSWCEVIKKYK